MMQSPKFSIITPTYNAEAFIERLYDSLCMQSFKNFEWVVVDDCSSDGTVAKLLSLDIPEGMQMKVFKLPINSGGSVAMASGIQQSVGDIVLLVDHDDQIFDVALQTISNEFEKIECEPNVAALTYKRINPNTMLPIGRYIQPGQVFTTSWLTAFHPETSDLLFAFKGEVLKQYFTPEHCEAVCLSGLLLQEMSSKYKFMMGADKPLMYYHRDNPDSQTNNVRVSRKTIYTYAKYLDLYDKYYLLNPWHWIKTSIALVKMSLFYYKKSLYSYVYIKSGLIRALVFASVPVGYILYLMKRKGMQRLDIPMYDLSTLHSIVNLRE